MSSTITAVRIRKPEESTNSRFIAYADIVLNDDFKVKNLRIVQLPTKLIVAMPNARVSHNGNRDDFIEMAHPITTELREQITQAVLDEYSRLNGE